MLERIQQKISEPHPGLMCITALFLKPFPTFDHIEFLSTISLVLLIQNAYPAIDLIYNPNTG
uniref:Uncharacterized protein n=1 Tax=Rhizophora mucronata TaxID=61149 RepID=A0A2P2MMR5_RHIMU